jgi:hypothetical protein
MVSRAILPVSCEIVEKVFSPENLFFAYSDILAKFDTSVQGSSATNFVLITKVWLEIFSNNLSLGLFQNLIKRRACVLRPGFEQKGLVFVTPLRLKIIDKTTFKALQLLLEGGFS